MKWGVVQTLSEITRRSELMGIVMLLSHRAGIPFSDRAGLLFREPLVAHQETGAFTC